MIFVQKQNDTQFSVKFKPVKSNLDRMREIPTAHYDGEKAWLCELKHFPQFERAFDGELIYATPRHVLANTLPPPPPGMYKKIPNEPITRIKIPYALYDYQKFGANFLACIASGAGHAFLTDSVGTGKTIMSIAGAQILQDQGKVDTVLVFCKASLKYQWLRDGVEKFTHDKGIVIDGTKKKREQLYQEAKDTKYRYILVNYEMLLHDYDLLEELVVSRNIKLVIADEAHKLSNTKGKMNNMLKKLVQPNKKKKYPGIDCIFFLTATPLASKIEQMYGLFSIRRPDFFGKFSDFSKNYMTHAFNGKHTELIGYRNLHEIRAKTWKFMLRRTSNEISMELPEVVEIFQDVQMTPLQVRLDLLAQQELDVITTRLAGLDRSVAPPEQVESLEGAAQSMFYVRKAVANHPEMLMRSQSANIYKRFGTIIENSPDRHKSPKLDELMDLVEQLVNTDNDKIVIFSEYETMIQIIRERLNKEGILNEIYTGKMSAREKDEAILRFHENPDCNIILGTDAMSEGLNLQIASTLIMVDLPWTPSTYSQRKGRIQRGGSVHKSVKVINLYARQGIDPSVWEAIQNKQSLFDYIVENTDEQSMALREAADGR